MLWIVFVTLMRLIVGLKNNFKAGIIKKNILYIIINNSLEWTFLIRLFYFSFQNIII